MAYVNVQSNGNAPSGTQIGDVVHTAGGDYSVVAPNTAGAKYNPSSGLWSIKVGADSSASTPLPSGKSNASSVDVDNATKNATDVNDRINQLMQQNADLANKISAYSSAQQYAYNREEAQKTRDWQEAMSGTAHQREVRDLLAAGLNPVLSAQLGGASTPAGATASGSSYQGQKADVDTSLLPYMSSIIGSYLGYNSQQNVARIQKETALETAKISSAASMYNANKSAQAAMFGAMEAASASRYGSDKNFEASNWQNKLFNYGIDFMNDFIGSGNSGKSNPLVNLKDYGNEKFSNSIPMTVFKALKEGFKNPNWTRDGGHGL